MNFSWPSLVAVALGYLITLFLTAFFAEKGKLPERWVKHPMVYVLAFGVSCSSWAFYGAVGMAYELQHGYMSFYIGLTTLLLFSAIIIRPLFRLAKNHQLSSLADLFAFRYRSRWAGLITAGGVFLAILPLLALQIQAITDVIVILDPHAHTRTIAGIISLILLYMTILFSTRDIKPTEKHPGLLFALAVEALFKLGIFLAIGYMAVTRLNGGFGEIENWMRSAPINFHTFNPELKVSQWASLILLFVSAPLVLPHLFQILFRENTKDHRLRMITWAAPIYLFLMALPVLPIMWAGIRTGSSLNPEYFTQRWFGD